MTWYAFHFELDAAITSSEAPEADLVADALVELGVEGIEWRDSQTPVVLVAALEAGGPDEAEALRLDLENRVSQSRLPARLSAVETYDDVDWSTHWRHHFSPLDFGPLWIVPSWLEPPPEAQVVMQVDPSSAFGTGLHPTTALCLEWVVAKRPTSVLDVGTGTGVLALAAVMLEAGARAVAIDNDPEAVRVAIENRGLNRVAPDRLELSDVPVGDLEGNFPAVIANVLAGPLVEMAPAISARVAGGGELVLSGLLVTQVDEVAAAYVQQGLRIGEVATRAEWARVSLHRPNAHGG